ncbi:sigma-70 family RNA polymerase sigma factor [Micromonospora sp. NPDC000207]|uniref:RNA polymerase sigma factor n=1 Tax=Micromonospora sp. NPDC000207 TaxID=3154246 RepID=UPI0033344BE8
MPSAKPTADPRTPADRLDKQHEWNLVRHAQNGDHDAFTRLYRDNHNLVLGYVLLRTGTHRRALAEDITAETFLRAWKHLHRYTQPRRRLSAWLNTIAHRLLLDHLKAHPTRYETPHGLTDDYTPHTPPDHTTSAEAAVIRKHDLQQALAAYQNLHTRHRQCLHLRFWAGQNLSQTARSLGTTTQDVRDLQDQAIHTLTRHRAETIPLRQWPTAHPVTPDVTLPVRTRTGPADSKALDEAVTRARSRKRPPSEGHDLRLRRGTPS